MQDLISKYTKIFQQQQDLTSDSTPDKIMSLPQVNELPEEENVEHVFCKPAAKKVISTGKANAAIHIKVGATKIQGKVILDDDVGNEQEMDVEEVKITKSKKEKSKEDNYAILEMIQASQGKQGTDKNYIIDGDEDCLVEEVDMEKPARSNFGPANRDGYSK
jgi:hypothetical protein